MNYAAALTGETHAALAGHLLQHEHAEDVCFALFRPSAGETRLTSLIAEPILPREGERRVHGNASVRSAYFERALGAALAAGAGLAFLHSHTRRSRDWQRMSSDDLATESTYAPRALAMTGHPLVGLTLAGDGHWSARLWEKTGRGEYARRDCESVRVVGERLTLSFHPTHDDRPSLTSFMAVYCPSSPPKDHPSACSSKIWGVRRGDANRGEAA